MSYTTHGTDPKAPESHPRGVGNVRADSLESTPQAAAKLSTTGAEIYCTPGTEGAECPKMERAKTATFTREQNASYALQGHQVCVSRKAVDSQYSCSST